MQKRTLFGIGILLVLLSGCASQQENISKGSISISNLNGYSKNTTQLLLAGKDEEAIEKYLNKVIADCKNKYNDKNVRVYNSRSLAATLYYMAEAASKKANNAIVVEPTCSEAFYFRAYARINLKQLEDARRDLDMAIKLSPVNSKYLSEKAHVFQIERDFKSALDTFSKAELYADPFSPKHLKDAELARKHNDANVLALGSRIINDKEWITKNTE